MSESRPIPLEYVSPHGRRTRVDWPRTVLRGVAMFAPLIGCYAWGELGCRWLVRQPWFRSGNPIEAIYSPKFIGAPLLIGTVWVGLVALFVIVMIARRRWTANWRTALPMMIIVWIWFFAMMFDLSEQYFP